MRCSHSIDWLSHLELGRLAQASWHGDIESLGRKESEVFVRIARFQRGWYCFSRPGKASIP
jgi:hypothetical protein